MRVDADLRRRLVEAASAITGRFNPSKDLFAASVGAAAISTSGRMFTGVCIDANCGLGFCAEAAAIAEMLKARESRILAIVAVNHRGEILAPCGRCRELIRQTDPGNWETEVVMPDGGLARLAELLPGSAPVEAPRPKSP